MTEDTLSDGNVSINMFIWPELDPFLAPSKLLLMGKVSMKYRYKSDQAWFLIKPFKDNDDLAHSLGV